MRCALFGFVLLLACGGCQSQPNGPTPKAGKSNTTSPDDVSPRTKAKTDAAVADKPGSTVDAATKAAVTEEPGTEETTGEESVLFAGLEGTPQLKELHKIEAAWKKSPEGLEEQLNYMAGLSFAGNLHIRQKHPDRAQACWLEAGRIAHALAAKQEKLDHDQQSMLATTFLNEARAYSLQEKPTEALASVNAAIDSGYRELDALNTHPDLENLRKAHDFAELLPAWETKATASGKEVAEQLLSAGKSFPVEFEVTDFDGQTHKPADYVGSVLIADIWGTWCPPCRKEIPHFARLVKEQGPAGFKMLGLNYNEQSKQDVLDFMKEHDVNYPCAMGPEELLKEVPDFQGFPTTLFFDRTGKVRLSVVGYHDYYVLNGIVSALLAEEAGTPEKPNTEEKPSTEEKPATQENAVTEEKPAADELPSDEEK